MKHRMKVLVCSWPSLIAACSAGPGPDGAHEGVDAQQELTGLLRVPGSVVGLLHNLNQGQPGTVMYSAPISSGASQRDGGDHGAPNHRGYEWWSLPDVTTNSAGYEALLPPGVVVALKHNVNQSSLSITAFGRDPTTGPASFPGFNRQTGGDRGASSGVGYFWYESTGTAFTNWAEIDALLPKYTVVGLKHSQNQPSKFFRWNGVTYDPVKPSPVPPGFRRMVGGDHGAPNGQGFYWYEKITGPEIVSKPTLRYALSRSLFMDSADPGAVDKDGDCLADAAEGELASFLRPFTIFDSSEHARRPGEPAGVFRVYPTSANGVHVRYVLLFQEDGGYGPSSACGDGHPGDNDTVDFDLVASNGGRNWELTKLELSFKGLNWPGNSRLESYSALYPVVYLSGSKHHEYFTRDIDGNDSIYSDVPILDDCNDDVDGRGARILVSATGLNGTRPNNVGEPGRHPSSTFVDSLDPLFPGKTIWGGEMFYDVGPNSAKFPAVTFPACPANNCAHSPCSEGAPLATSCFADAADVCSFDPYCCSTWWDSICVSEVASSCN